MIPEKPPYASNDCLTFLEYLQLRTAGPGFREYVSREFERTYSATGNFVLTAEKLYTSPPHRHDPIQRKVEFANALPDKFREKKKLVARAHAMKKKKLLTGANKHASYNKHFIHSVSTPFSSPPWLVERFK